MTKKRTHIYIYDLSTLGAKVKYRYYTNDKSRVWKANKKLTSKL